MVVHLHAVATCKHSKIRDSWCRARKHNSFPVLTMQSTKRAEPEHADPKRVDSKHADPKRARFIALSLKYMNTQILKCKACNPLHSIAQHTSPPVLSAGSAGTVSWTALATIVTTPSMAVAMVVLGSLGTACSDVVVDSIVVERSRGEPQVML